MRRRRAPTDRDSWPPGPHREMTGREFKRHYRRLCRALDTMDYAVRRGISLREGTGSHLGPLDLDRRDAKLRRMHAEAQGTAREEMAALFGPDPNSWPEMVPK